MKLCFHSFNYPKYLLPGLMVWESVQQTYSAIPLKPQMYTNRIYVKILAETFLQFLNQHFHTSNKVSAN